MTAMLKTPFREFKTTVITLTALMEKVGRGQDQMDGFSRDVGGKESNGNANTENHGHRDEGCL